MYPEPLGSARHPSAQTCFCLVIVSVELFFMCVRMFKDGIGIPEEMTLKFFASWAPNVHSMQDTQQCSCIAATNSEHVCTLHDVSF